MFNADIGKTFFMAPSLPIPAITFGRANIFSNHKKYNATPHEHFVNPTILKKEEEMPG